MSVSIAKIAKKARLSKATVSKSLRNYSEISEKTKKRVLRVAAQMGYSQDEIKSLSGQRLSVNHAKSKRTFTVNLVFYQKTQREIYTHPYFSVLAERIHRKFIDNDYLVLESYPQERKDYYKLLDSSNADGTILMSNVEKLEEDIIHKLEIYANSRPLIFLSNYLSDYNEKFHSVRADNFSNGYIATQHLLRQGVRDIFFIDPVINLMLVMDRYFGYQKAVSEYGIKPMKICFDVTNPAPDLTSVKKILNGSDRPLGFAGGVDFSCMELHEFLNEKGLYDLGRIHFAGCDGYPDLKHDDIREASTRVNLEEMVNQSFNLFSDILDNKVEKPKHILVGSDLVKRKEQ